MVGGKEINNMEMQRLHGRGMILKDNFLFMKRYLAVTMVQHQKFIEKI